jgi:RNA polymerase sigma factor (sigma-70 family)
LDDFSSPKQKWVLTSESFDEMLFWLHQDRNIAGELYEKIRRGLNKRFQQLGCSEPEELTNRTFDRVAKKLPEIITEYKGEREPYFFSIALFIYKEWLRRPVMLSLTTIDFPHPDTTSAEELFDKELLDSCLQDCLEKLSPNSRDMIKEYYRGERKVKIESRQRLADQLGIKLSNLRLRAQRIRTALKECILDCMERKAMEPQALM